MSAQNSTFVSNAEIVGSISSKNNRYSTHFETNFNVDGSPKTYDLEKMFNAPQDEMINIVGFAKYCYRKYGIIMRVINIIRDFGASGFRLNYPKKDQKVKSVIQEYNQRIHMNKLLNDMMYEIAMTGNLVAYDREGKNVDIYPINLIEVIPLKVNNKQVVAIKVNDLFNVKALTYDDKIVDKIKQGYPEEIGQALEENKEYAILDENNVFFTKINSSRYERYGVPIILPAFEDLAHKSLLKEAEKSTAVSVIDKIMLVTVGDENNKPSKALIDQYSQLFDNVSGSVRATVPYYVNIKWVEPDTSYFGKDKFIQIDTDILSTLGVSLALIKGDGGGNYSECAISFTGLIQMINAMRDEIPSFMHQLYRNELQRNGLNPDHAPTVQLNEVVIDKDAKLNLVKSLFTEAGLPYEVLYEECGYDYDYIKLIREEENKNQLEETFKLHAMPYQGNSAGQVGAPTLPISNRKSDKNQSNNKQPRPDISGRS